MELGARCPHARASSGSSCSSVVSVAHTCESGFRAGAPKLLSARPTKHAVHHLRQVAAFPEQRKSFNKREGGRTLSLLLDLFLGSSPKYTLVAMGNMLM